MKIEIETKYNIGDLVYVIKSNPPVITQIKITQFDIVIKDGYQNVLYACNGIPVPVYTEDELFDNIESARKYIADSIEVKQL